MSKTEGHRELIISPIWSNGDPHGPAYHNVCLASIYASNLTQSIDKQLKCEKVYVSLLYFELSAVQSKPPKVGRNRS